MSYKLFGLLLAGFTVVAVPMAHAADCGDLSSKYGPFDYTDPEDVKNRLPVVERFHFTPRIESLAMANTGKLTADLDYTLHAFPNHHRALHAMARYDLINLRPSRANYYTAECYFHRAMLFKPDDGVVRMLYAVYLQNKGKPQQALERYKEALILLPEFAELHYNLATLYLDIKDITKAREHAKAAYHLGATEPALRERMMRMGVWSEREDKWLEDKKAQRAAALVPPEPPAESRVKILPLLDDE